MKRIMSLLLVAGLGWVTIGCNSDPGISVETEVTESEQAEMDMIGGDYTAEGITDEEAPNQ